MKKKEQEDFLNSRGVEFVQKWMSDQQMKPFAFQEETWEKFDQGFSGLVIAPTGFGKTYSVFLALVIHFQNHPEEYQPGLKLLWVTPLRSLAKDIARAMTEALNGMGIDWIVGVRNGDTSASVKQQQTRMMPDILIVTPESLHLLFAQKQHERFFKDLKCVAIDEWHELLGSKRGVLVELGLSHLISINNRLRIWGITATIGNLDEALHVLIPYKMSVHIVTAKEKKKIEIISVIPDDPELLPWAGHMGTKMVEKIIPIIEASKTTLIFTNTRNQAEVWYQHLLNTCPELAGLMAIHHSSIDAHLRIWIEDNLGEGLLKAVVTTSSLDLGVDFKPVDTVIQIGSSKGVARFLQRAGRSGHSPFETSKIYFVPTHSLELIEVAALKEAYKQYKIEERIPQVLCFDVLVQYLVTRSLGGGFYPQEIIHEIKATHAFQYMNEEEWNWMLQFITTGGALENYEEYHKVEIEADGKYVMKSRRLAMLHRMNLGVIVSDVMIKVKYMGGGYVGMIEEYFITRLNPGESFVLSGRILELIMIKDQEALVRNSKAKKAITPSWQGGRLPLTSYLSQLLREKLASALHAKATDKELHYLQPLLSYQSLHSKIPLQDEFLVELISTDEGHHLFMYPFEGRLVHEVMSALIAFRIGKLAPLSFSIAMNDYGFELLSEEEIPVDESMLKEILSPENLMTDVISSINATEMARRKFRDIAVISGLVIQNYPGLQKNNKGLQSTSNIIFKVLEQYDEHNLLIRQSYQEVFNQQFEEFRLQEAFIRIAKSKIVFIRSSNFTPLSFPIKVDSLRQTLSSEQLEQKIRRMQNSEVKNKKKQKAGR